MRKRNADKELEGEREGERCTDTHRESFYMFCYKKCNTESNYLSRYIYIFAKTTLVTRQILVNIKQVKCKRIWFVCSSWAYFCRVNGIKWNNVMHAYIIHNTTQHNSSQNVSHNDHAQNKSFMNNLYLEKPTHGSSIRILRHINKWTQLCIFTDVKTHVYKQ